MRIIAIKRTDGGVSIMRIFNDKATVKSQIDKWENGSGRTAESYQEITEADIPLDRIHRDAWSWV